MAPIAIHTPAPVGNGTTLKATATPFTPTTATDPTKYHAASSDEAMQAEAKHAAHNYHPLPIVFARASGCNVWDPEGRCYLDFVSAKRQSCDDRGLTQLLSYPPTALSTRAIVTQSSSKH